MQFFENYLKIVDFRNDDLDKKSIVCHYYADGRSILDPKIVQKWRQTLNFSFSSASSGHNNKTSSNLYAATCLYKNVNRRMVVVYYYKGKYQPQGVRSYF